MFHVEIVSLLRDHLISQFGVYDKDIISSAIQYIFKTGDIPKTPRGAAIRLADFVQILAARHYSKTISGKLLDQVSVIRKSMGTESMLTRTQAIQVWYNFWLAMRHLDSAGIPVDDATRQDYLVLLSMSAAQLAAVKKKSSTFWWLAAAGLVGYFWMRS